MENARDQGNTLAARGASEFEAELIRLGSQLESKAAVLARVSKELADAQTRVEELEKACEMFEETGVACQEKNEKRIAEAEERARAAALYADNVRHKLLQAESLADVANEKRTAAEEVAAALREALDKSIEHVRPAHALATIRIRGHMSHVDMKCAG